MSVLFNQNIYIYIGGCICEYVHICISMSICMFLILKMIFSMKQVKDHDDFIYNTKFKSS